MEKPVKTVTIRVGFMATVSVVISAYNNQDKIRDCLESVKWASEIVFVDNSSTDNTPNIAKEFTEKVFTRPNNPMLNVNKNFGFTKATGDWILCLDSDERVTPGLQKEIQLLVRSEKLDVNGFWIPRENIIFGKWIRHSGWYPDYQMRFFKKGKGKFPEIHVHEMIKITGETEKIEGHIKHLNYENITQFLNKLTNIYTPNEAEVLTKQGYKFNWADSIRMPTKEFINRFFAKSGYKDGLHGLVLALLMAFYHLVVFVKIWENHSFHQQEIKLSNIASENKKLKHEFDYWFLTALIEMAKNPLAALVLRIKRKLLS